MFVIQALANRLEFAVTNLRIDYAEAYEFVATMAISSFESWRIKDRLTTLDVLNKWEASKGLPLTKPE